MTDTTLDLDAIRAEWLQQCPSCDAGLPAACTHPDRDYRPVMADLAAEVERLRAQRDALAAELDGDRHEWEPCKNPPEIHMGPPGHCGKCGAEPSHRRWHATARVVLAEQDGKTR